MRWIFSAVKRANYVINFRVLESEPVIPHLSRGFHKDVTDVAIIWGHVFFFFFFWKYVMQNYYVLKPLKWKQGNSILI